MAQLWHLVTQPPVYLGYQDKAQPTGDTNMNPLTKHTQQQGVTYLQHWGFAMGIAYRLLISVIAFALHAMLPFLSIEPQHDLEATASFLEERNHWIETAPHSQYGEPERADRGSKLAHI